MKNVTEGLDEARGDADAQVVWATEKAEQEGRRNGDVGVEHDDWCRTATANEPVTRETDPEERPQSAGGVG